MLSYQHIYHAGNLADVHKHALLCWMLSYMTVKDKPMTYIETHAGRGLYDLASDEAVKTGEAAAGIATILDSGLLPLEHPYMQRLAEVRARHGDTAYPGSPVLAALSLRASDKMHFAELHPREFAALQYAMSPFQAACHQRDGFELALAITPPDPRRGLLLIDPSYEIKTDYETIPAFIAKLHKKWNVGVIALWYPILGSGAHGPMLRALEALALPDVLRHEVRFAPSRGGHRMVGSGMFVVNAPFGSGYEAKRLTKAFDTLATKNR